MSTHREDPSDPVRSLQVLGEDNHVLAVLKPAGWPVVPDESGDPSLLEVAREWVRVRHGKPGRAFLAVVHRLDRPVSGVVLFGRTSKGAARLAAAFREGRVEKVYRAVLEGAPEPPRGVLEIWLVKDSATNRSRVVAPGSAGARRAVTRWQVLQSDTPTDPACGVEFRPLTGRSHQLRVTAAALGHPLLGDVKYGAARPLADRSIALHAASIEVPHPTRDELLVFEAPLPDAPFWHRAR